jgi:acetylglutamate kinase
MVTTVPTKAINANIEDHHVIERVFKSSKELKGKILVIELGGSTLEYQRTVLQDVVWLHDLGVYPLLVLGGGPYINEWLKRLGIQVHFENGLRVTDSQTFSMGVSHISF